MRRFVAMFVLLAVTMAVSSEWAIAQTAARGLQPGNPSLMVYRNKSGSTMYKKDPAELDTAWVRLFTLGTRALILPETLTVDSFDVNPANEGAPFRLRYLVGGMQPNADTIFVTGTTITSLRLPFGISDLDTTTYEISGALLDSLQVSTIPLFFTSITEVRSRTSGSAKDTMNLWYEPVFGMADADSAEEMDDFIGVVSSDSIADDSLGYVVVGGPAFTRINGNNSQVKPGDWLTTGTTGFVKYTIAAGDTLHSGRLGIPNIVTAKSLHRTRAGSDSGWIWIRSIFH